MHEPSNPSRPSRKRPTLLMAALVSFALTFTGTVGAGIASAGQATSAFGYYSDNGVNYKNQSIINTNHSDNHQAYAVTLAYVTAGTAPSGWVGALPRRTNSSGSVVCTGTWAYSSSSMNSGNYPLNPSGCFINNHSAYGSDGQTKAFNGSSYNTYGAFTSPNQNS